MSSSSRKLVARVALRGALLGSALIASPLFAAQTQFVPRLEIGGGWDSNRDLFTENENSSASYYALAEARILLDTPRSNTTVRPRLGYYAYPDSLSDDSSTLALLDAVHSFRSLRSQFDLYAGFDRRDTYSSELANPQFDPLNPTPATNSETGRIGVSGTRQLITLQPSYTYRITERWNAVIDGVAQSADYSGIEASSLLSSYRFYQGRVSAARSLSQRVGLSGGVYASRQEAKDDSVNTDATGVSLALDHSVSSTWSGKLELNYERNEVDYLSSLLGTEKKNAFGGSYTMSWKGLVSALQLNVGRTFSPSGTGGKVSADQLQVEYRRDLSARLTAGGAARYIKYQALTLALGANDYDYGIIDLNLDWKLSRTWYVRGGTSYIRQKFDTVGGTANNYNVYLSCGYQALERPR